MNAWNKGKTKQTDKRIEKQSISLSNAYKEGKFIGRKSSFKGKKHTEDSKNKIRKARIDYLKKDNQISTFSNRTLRKMSYGEFLLHTIFLQNNIYEKYTIINEYCEYPYIIDFAFINEKVAVEYDGEMHFKNGLERYEHDIKKDEYLKSLGWRIYRIPYFEFKNFKINDLIEFVGSPLKNTNTKNYNNFIKYNQYKKEKAKNKKEEKERINKLKIENIETLKEKILNSNVDFTKFGWVNEISHLLKCSPQHVNRWMKKHLPDFYDKCFKRKTAT